MIGRFISENDAWIIGNLTRDPHLPNHVVRCAVRDNGKDVLEACVVA